jgi:amino acid adenylation domain-containing protein/thioester reductase-like protein
VFFINSKELMNEAFNFIFYKSYLHHIVFFALEQAHRERIMLNIQTDMVIHQLVEAQALQTPDTVAVVFLDRQLTYRELNQKANQLAHHLRELGVKPDVLVGVCIERSLEMLIALLAVLKAGGAYVPLDPSYPTDRLAFMLEDSKLPILLTEKSQLEKLPQNSAHIVDIESDWDFIAQQNQENLETQVNANNLAYTIYTSGSTGKPKGVQILHGAVVNFLQSMRQEPGLTARDTLLAVTTISFDIAVLELFLPLTVGARILLASRATASDGAQLSRLMAESGATFMQATPATWQLLLAIGWKGDRTLKILCGGEAMTRNLANQLLNRCASLWNMYGPTETTIWSAVHQVDSSNDSVPIGHPIANTQIYLIDRECQRNSDPLQLVPVGQPGEVYIGGDGLARGYLNRPEMNQERFIPDPFSSKPNARLYKTGDLARYLPNGNIQFIGRVDHQVKIRGYRIELGDIETALSEYPGVKEAAVIVREDSLSEKRLVAYVTSKASSTEIGPMLQSSNGSVQYKASGILIPQIRLFLKEKLPEYMVPSAFVLMEAMPLTPNGKIDRRALPIPSQERPELAEVLVLPRNPIEEKLANLWSYILDIQLIGIHDNFFDLGGNSLLVAKMASQVEETFQLELPLSCLFETPTIAGLAQSIENAQYLNAEIDRSNQPDLQADSVLDPTIFPEAHFVESTQEPQNIFLTGATGFLGAFLLDELLRKTQANIYCLVRCPILEVGKEKLQRNLKHYSLLQYAHSDRIIPVLGDLSQPLLGLSPQQFNELASQMDVIYHNGAFVNLIYPYAPLRNANVLGTQEILRLASQVKVKPVHYISTLDVFHSSHYENKMLSEQDDFAGYAGPDGGYAQSKWVAEKLVMAAYERGIPTTIYRPGMIIGHSQTGVSNTEDMVGRLIKGLIQLESSPKIDLQMNLTPVDYVSQSIVHLSRQQTSWGQAFHLSNPHTLLLEQLAYYIQSLGYKMQPLSYDRWYQKLLGPGIDRQNALSPFALSLTLQNNLEVLNLGKVSCLNAIKELSQVSIHCPPINTNLLDTYFSYFRQSGFLENPQNPCHRNEGALVH